MADVQHVYGKIKVTVSIILYNIVLEDVPAKIL